MKSSLIFCLVVAGGMVASIAPMTVKAEPQMLTVSEMDAVTAGRRGWGGWRGLIISGNSQSNHAEVHQNVSAYGSCMSNCSVSLSASATAVVVQSNNFDVD